MNRAALHELELDAADKFRALSLDSAAHHMTVSSRGLNFHLGIENVDNTYEFLVYFYKLISMNNQIYFKFFSVASPDSWAKFTEDNIRRSASERAQSDEYLNMADNLLKETASDMWNQYNTVNESFEQRLHETNEAKDKIQNHLSAVCFVLFLY